HATTPTIITRVTHYLSFSRSIPNRNPHSFPTRRSSDLETDQEEVARLVSRYDFLALPVVTPDRQMLGIITVDDVIMPSICRSGRSEEHTSELQSRSDLVCRLLLEKKKKQPPTTRRYTHV